MNRPLNLSVPITWNQLSRSQVKQVCRLFLGDYSREEFLVRAFLMLAGVKALPDPSGGRGLYFKKGRVEFRLETWQMADFVSKVEYLLDEPRLSVNRFPVIRFGLWRFWGPSLKCYNLTLNEYIHGYRAVHGYVSTGEFRYVDQLCAVLYRPSGQGSAAGDRRRAFDGYSHLKYSGWFRWVSRPVRLAVLLFFQGSQWEMRQAFPAVFPGSVTSSEMVNPVPHLQQIVRILNQDDITRNNKILKTPVWAVFGQLNDQIIRMRNQKKNGKI